MTRHTRRGVRDVARDGRAVNAPTELQAGLDVTGSAGVRRRFHAHRRTRSHRIRGEMRPVTRRAGRGRGTHGTEQGATMDAVAEIAAGLLVAQAACHGLCACGCDRVRPSHRLHGVTAVAGNTRRHVDVPPTLSDAVRPLREVCRGTLVTAHARCLRAFGWSMLACVAALTAERPMCAAGKLLEDCPRPTVLEPLRLSGGRTGDAERKDGPDEEQWPHVTGSPLPPLSRADAYTSRGRRTP
jgi:hypothetical protein